MNHVDVATVTPSEFPLTVRVRDHVFACDAGVAEGSKDAAPGAHDYFDAALASCKALTAMWYAKRKGIPLERVETHVDSDNSKERAGVYKLTVRVELFGPMTPEQRSDVHRAISACPVHKLMTTSEVQIETVAPGEQPSG